MSLVVVKVNGSTRRVWFGEERVKYEKGGC